MVKKIESYNASYPASFYEIGTVYSFYAKTNVTGMPATQEHIGRYSSALKELEIQQRSNAIQPVKASFSKASYTSSDKSSLTRYYAVVVSKSTTSIEVMFLNDDNGSKCYLTKKYIVRKSCTTDGKELMTPTTKTNFSESQGVTKKTGGITKVRLGDTDKRVGGITRAGRISTNSANVGGITKAKNQRGSVMTPVVSSQMPAKVGGITRIKK